MYGNISHQTLEKTKCRVKPRICSYTPYDYTVAELDTHLVSELVKNCSSSAHLSYYPVASPSEAFSQCLGSRKSPNVLSLRKLFLFLDLLFGGWLSLVVDFNLSL